MKLPVYLDHHATTPVDPRVLEAMMPYLTMDFGNAASTAHPFGWRAKEAVEKAREQVAHLIGAEPKEIIFTSGATESNNLALKGAAQIYEDKGNHLVTAATEHKAVLDVCKYLSYQGKRITILEVDEKGRLALENLEQALSDETILISLMHANNEIGTIHPIETFGKIAHERGIIFHVDAAQSAGKIPIDVKKYHIDLLSLSAHKLYGPKGVGALYVRHQNPRVRLTPLMHGGGHEEGLRSGTLNVPAIVGFGKASEIAAEEMSRESHRLERLRDRLEQSLFKNIDQVYVNGDIESRLPHGLNMSFACVESENLIMAVNDELAVSSGSACTDGSVDTSHVLSALKLARDRAHTAIRFGLGRFNTEEEIDFAAARITEAVGKLRRLSPLWLESTGRDKIHRESR